MTDYSLHHPDSINQTYSRLSQPHSLYGGHLLTDPEY